MWPLDPVFTGPAVSARQDDVRHWPSTENTAQSFSHFSSVPGFLGQVYGDHVLSVRPALGGFLPSSYVKGSNIGKRLLCSKSGVSPKSSGAYRVGILSHVLWAFALTVLFFSVPGRVLPEEVEVPAQGPSKV